MIKVALLLALTSTLAPTICSESRGDEQASEHGSPGKPLLGRVEQLENQLHLTAGAEDTIEFSQDSLGSDTQTPEPTDLTVSEIICYPGSHSSPSNRPLEARGPECLRCVAGELCSFQFFVRPPAFWEYQGSFQWDLMVTLEGPTAVHGYATPIPTLDATGTFNVAYRTFEPGEYRVSVVCLCGVLGGVDPLDKSEPWEYATWKLTVLPRGPELDPVDPCTVSRSQGRWLWQEGSNGGEYNWVSYNCGRSRRMKDSLAALAAKGMFEVAFYGDSHLRQLLFHLLYMTQGHVDKTRDKWHGDLSYNFTVKVPKPLRAQVMAALEKKEKEVPLNRTLVIWMPPSGSPLYVNVVLNFYWVDGVYTNGEYGCKDRGMYSNRTDRWPAIPYSTDVVITDSGVWTSAFCDRPLPAYSRHLSELYDHISSSIRESAKLVTFGTMPLLRCAQRPHNSNSLKAHMNDMARTLGEAYGALSFDLWDVVAPRFTSTCTHDLSHYSCFSKNKKKIEGSVGEGLTLAFLHFLTNVV